MDHKELIELKLLMGISPSVAIDPHELRAMWQQLCFERLHARRPRDQEMPRLHATHLLPTP